MRARRFTGKLPLITLAFCTSLAVGCQPSTEPQPDENQSPSILDGTTPVANLAQDVSPTATHLNVLADPSRNCGQWEQENLREPDKIKPVDGMLKTQLVVAMKFR